MFHTFLQSNATKEEEEEEEEVFTQLVNTTSQTLLKRKTCSPNVEREEMNFWVCS